MAPIWNSSGRGEGRRDQQQREFPPQLRLVALAMLFLGLGLGGGGRLDPRAVAGLRHRVGQVGEAGDAGNRAHVGPLDGEIDVGLDDARHLAQGLLDAGRAGAAGHALDGKGEGLRGHLEAGLDDGVGDGGHGQAWPGRR